MNEFGGMTIEECSELNTITVEHFLTAEETSIELEKALKKTNDF